jgi:hypothetical protein
MVVLINGLSDGVVLFKRGVMAMVMSTTVGAYLWLKNSIKRLDLDPTELAKHLE